VLQKLARKQTSSRAAAFDSDSLLTNVPPLLDVENLLIDLVVAFVRLARPMV